MIPFCMFPSGDINAVFAIVVENIFRFCYITIFFDVEKRRESVDYAVESLWIAIF